MFKRSEKSKVKSLKRKYQKLIKQGKKIFKKWDQKGKPPERLVAIQKKLRELYQAIEAQKLSEDLQFFAEHPEVYEFLPNEI